MSAITYTISREISEEEIESMIHGTGALAHEWWGECKKTDNGWRITHYDGDDGENGVCKYTDLTEDMIADAVGECVRLEYLDPTTSDVQEALTENLGYLDAQGADVVLQWAVFNDLVYG